MFSKMILDAEKNAALGALLEKITLETRARLVADKLDCEANINNAEATSRSGRVYFKIIVGNSVRYFVRKADGVIFASAGRNAPNFNRSFGTLWTIDDFNWGEYEARSKPGTPWRMVMMHGSPGYMTAELIP